MVGTESGAKSGALGAPDDAFSVVASDVSRGDVDPDLAIVVASWPTLPADVRASIVAMVKAASVT